MLVELHNVEWMRDAMIGHLGDVNKSVVMDTNIYKGTKIGDIGNDAREYHTFDEVFNRTDILIKLKGFKLLAGVTTWLFQLGYDVG